MSVSQAAKFVKVDTQKKRIQVQPLPAETVGTAETAVLILLRTPTSPAIDSSKAS